MGELSPKVTERARMFAVFGLKFHVSGRKSRTIKQSAQKAAEKFGEGPLTVPGKNRGSYKKADSGAAAQKNRNCRPQTPRAAIYFLIWEPYQKNINTFMKKVLTWTQRMTRPTGVVSDPDTGGLRSKRRFLV